MKSKIKSLLVFGYNHGWLGISFVDFWFKNLNLRES
ncbi:Uncharacterised protein [Salmonella enterica subsp. enterica]|nr:Uncharacterised protein [Salmonella enterica subsp. enterica]